MNDISAFERKRTLKSHVFLTCEEAKICCQHEGAQRGLSPELMVLSCLSGTFQPLLFINHQVYGPLLRQPKLKHSS